MKPLIVVLSFVIVSSTSAAIARADQTPDPAPILKCWDHTFTYTYLTVTPNVGNPDTLMDVEFQSEAQTKFAGIIPATHLGWGNAQVNFDLAKSECQFENGSTALMSCETNRGLIYISYDESAEVRKTLRLEIGDLKFSTQITDGFLETKVSFTKKSESKAGSIDLYFRAENGTCN